MNHPFEADFAKYIHNEMNAGESAEFLAHTEICQECGSLLQTQLNMHSCLVLLDGIEPAADTVDKVVLALRKSQQIMDKGKRFFQIVVTIFALMILLILAFTVWMLYPQLQKVDLMPERQITAIHGYLGNIAKAITIFRFDPYLLIGTIAIFGLSCLYLFIFNFRAMKHQLNGRSS